MIKGEMEKTMFTTFTITQRLRTIFQPSQLPKEVHPLVDAFNRTFDSKTRGTHMGEDFDWDPGSTQRCTKCSLPKAVYQLLEDWYYRNNPSTTNISRHAVFETSVYAGVTYKTAAQSLRDSHVMFCVEGDTERERWRAGSITSIFQHGGKLGVTFLLIEPFRPAEAEAHHPFVFQHSREFAFVTGSLFYTKDRLPPVLVSLRQAVGHFAFANIEYKDSSGQILFQALPLEKVS